MFSSLFLSLKLLLIFLFSNLTKFKLQTAHYIYKLIILKPLIKGGIIHHVPIMHLAGFLQQILDHMWKALEIKLSMVCPLEIILFRRLFTRPRFMSEMLLAFVLRLSTDSMSPSRRLRKNHRIPQCNAGD